VYAHKDIYDEFVQEVVHLTRSLRQGNPLEETNIEVGAMTTEDQMRIVEDHIQDAVGKGARILTGGKRSGKGKMYFEPTVLINVNEQMKAVSEETFGPLLPIMKVDNEQDAVQCANNSIYGLSAYVFTKNTRKGRQIAELLEAGTVMVNDAMISYGFPETPWQGVKASGIGRSHSDEGLKDLCHSYHVNYDTISIPKFLWDDFWVWHPYSAEKISRFRSMYGFLFVPYGLMKKIGLLKNMLWPRPEE
jgi:acyl-CoA reductase-like NAD-dependent aldehyde dehydrogenase